MIPKPWLWQALERRRQRTRDRLAAAARRGNAARARRRARPRDPVIKLSAARFIRVLQGMIAHAKPRRIVEPPWVAEPVWRRPPPRARKVWFGVDVGA